MNQKIWNEFDQYTTDLLIPESVHLSSILKKNEESGLPAYDVSAPQGKLLQILVKISSAQTILEIGTLGGYSTIWMAGALPENGRLISLELNPDFAEVARKNVKQVSLSHKVEIRVGPALETLKTLKKENAHPFDLIFIDADKPNNPAYLKSVLELSRNGTLIVADNVVREGEVLDAESKDPKVQGIRRFNDILGDNKQLRATTIQTVGIKGYDGFSLIHVSKNT